MMFVNISRASLLSLLVCLTTGLTPAMANPDMASRYLSSPELVGEGRMKVMFWSVFDAELYSNEGQFDADSPFVLSLSYLRSIKGEQIVDKTIDEISRQGGAESGQLARWKQSLQAIIPDVDSSTTITGVRDDQANTVLYSNGERIGFIEDPAFTEAFFNIWLGANSSQPALTKQLTGQLES